MIEARGNGAGPRRLGLVLSGGGARGAYEAGVLSYIFGDFTQRLGRRVHFDIVTGTSVGAIHACYVAASQDDEGASERLADIWRSLSLEEVYRVGASDLLRVPIRLLGFGRMGEITGGPTADSPERIEGLFDTSRLEELVLGRIPWKQLRRNLESGSLEALAVAATEIATGRSIVFIDSRLEAPAWPRDPFIVAHPTRIRPEHALASAAIPLLFPAIRIGGAYYCDGGLRLNTPLAPALRLGADRVMVVGLRHPSTRAEEDRLARRRETNYSSLTYLAGKVLNALLLDRIEYDVDRLELFNAILESGVRSYGPGFIERINEPITALRNTPYRIVRKAFLRPSEDLGVIASECLHTQPPTQGIRDWFSRNIARYTARGALGEADLLSYLFFDRCYAERLLDLGRRDAENATDELLEFFGE